jgi:competence protein ComEC
LINLGNSLTAERERLSLFLPVVLGLGIICGVFCPASSPITLFKTLIGVLFASAVILRKSRILAVTVFIFALGLYVSQTGGILETTFLPGKKFIETDANKIKFTATVGFIDETHPTMRGMRRITLREMEFRDAPELGFVKTSKMTCSESMTKDLQPNDVVEVFGKLSPYKTAAIPGSFDQLQYNALIKLDSTGIVYKIRKIGDRGSVNDIFSYMRRYITKGIMQKIELPAGGIASALLTGDKSSIQPDIRDKFINSGTAHILAISGLHMSIAATLVFLILFKLTLYASNLFRRINARQFSAVATIPITFLYLALSGFSPSAVRAFIMTTISLTSLAMGRKAISLRSISAAAFLMLLFDAGTLFLVSFQLSFCAVVALISGYETMQPLLTRLRSKYCATNRGKVCFYIISSSITTLIATIATSPVSIATFNRLSLSGILGNLAAIPAISFVIAPLGIVALITCPITDFFAECIGIVLECLIATVGYISELPGSIVVIKSPTIWALYLIVIGGVIWALLKTYLRNLGCIPLLVGVLLWIFEEPPDIIVPPRTDTVCFAEDGTFYSTSLQKGRRQVLSIQRNTGFDGKLIKKEISNFPLERRMYEDGLYIWSKSKRIMRLAKRKHPYCPAYLVDY